MTPTVRRSLAIATMCLGLNAVAQTHYSVQHISQPSELSNCFVTSLDSKGRVGGGGINTTAGSYDGFVTKSAGKGLKPLQEPGPYGEVFGVYINDNGLVAVGGYAYSHAYLTDVNGSFVTDLTSVLHDNMATLYAVNNAGLVVGSRGSAQSRGTVFLLDAATMAITEIASIGVPSAISDHGVVVGTDWYAHQAFVAPPPYSTAYSIQPIWAASSKAMAVNKKSEVVGSYVAASSGQTRPFIGKGTQLFTELQVPGALDAEATGINIASTIVGNFTDPITGNKGAFRCSGDCSDFVDLDTLATLPHDAHIEAAKAINKAGQILVQGSNAKFYLLSPES